MGEGAFFCRKCLVLGLSSRYYGVSSEGTTESAVAVAAEGKPLSGAKLSPLASQIVGEHLFLLEVYSWGSQVEAIESEVRQSLAVVELSF